MSQRKRPCDQNDKEENSKKGNFEMQENYIKRKFIEQIVKKDKPTPHYKCNKCTFVSIAEENAMSHILRPTCSASRKKKVIEVHCARCNMIFPSEAANSQHYREIHMEPLICSKCPGVEFNSRKSKQRHMECVHEDPKFKCQLCREVFGRKEKLNKHIFKMHLSVEVRSEQDLSFEMEEEELSTT